MKSFCIKLSSRAQENFLIEELSSIKIIDFVISSFKFKVYRNVIVHYKVYILILFKCCFLSP